MENLEIRKDVGGYEWLYQVSSLWNVKSISHYVNITNKKWNTFPRYIKGKLIKKYKNKQTWYLFVWLHNNNNIIIKNIHRLVAINFLNQEYSSDIVMHLNSIKTDNRVENLKWWSYTDNIKQSYDEWRKWSNLWKSWIYHPNSKKVNQYTLDWVFIKTRDSIADFTRSRWKPWIGSHIWTCCKWKTNNAYWYIRKYFNI